MESGGTNAWLETKCGPRFIRLGSAPGKWLSEGVPSKLQCRAANRVELEPEE
jgi:hypothetical protein